MRVFSDCKLWQPEKQEPVGSHEHHTECTVQPLIEVGSRPKAGDKKATPKGGKETTRKNYTTIHISRPDVASESPLHRIGVQINTRLLLLPDTRLCLLVLIAASVITFNALFVNYWTKQSLQETHCRLDRLHGQVLELRALNAKLLESAVAMNSILIDLLQKFELVPSPHYSARQKRSTADLLLLDARKESFPTSDETKSEQSTSDNRYGWKADDDSFEHLHRHQDGKPVNMNAERDDTDAEGEEEKEEISLSQMSDTKLRRSTKWNQPNRKGVSVAHLKGGQPEAVVEDGGIVSPWFFDEEAAGEFKLSDSAFQLNRGKSKVEITEEGLYFIYAQVYYLTSSNLNGYSICVHGRGKGEEQTVAHCSVAGAGRSSLAELSCYTGVARHLRRGDRVSILQHERNRHILLRDGQTFLGLVLLARRH